MQEISTLVSMYLVVSDLRIVMDRRSVRVTAVSPWISRHDPMHTYVLFQCIIPNKAPQPV